MRPGDALVIAGALMATVLVASRVWQQQAATRVQLFQNGRLYAEIDLAANRMLDIPGPLGPTTVEVAGGRARIAADPSPRQYCVQAGWLQHAGDSATCLPNRTAIVLVAKQAAYDSLGY